MYDDHWQRGVPELPGILEREFLTAKNISEIAQVSEETLGSFAAAETPEEAKEVEVLRGEEPGAMFLQKRHSFSITEVLI